MKGHLKLMAEVRPGLDGRACRWALEEMERLFQMYVDANEALFDLLGQFDQAHDALGVERSQSAQEAIRNAWAVIRFTAPNQTNRETP